MTEPSRGGEPRKSMSESTVSRRRAIALAGVGVAGIAGAAAVGGAVVRGEAGSDAAADAVHGAIPFTGEHQAGIVTPAQDRLHFVAFDVITKDRDRLVAMLKDWTAAAARMTAGRDAGQIGAVDGVPEAPPD